MSEDVRDFISPMGISPERMMQTAEPATEKKTSEYRGVCRTIQCFTMQMGLMFSVDILLLLSETGDPRVSAILNVNRVVREVKKAGGTRPTFTGLDGACWRDAAVVVT